MHSTAELCRTCGALVSPAGSYHPYLYCELVRLGHPRPEEYLRRHGFVRDEQAALDGDHAAA